MLPKFRIIEHVTEGRPTRYSVETSWQTPDPDLGRNVMSTIGIASASGTLGTSLQTWGSRKLAEAAIEQCKRRLR